MAVPSGRAVPKFPMMVEACKFETERLLVSGWHTQDAIEQQLRDLADVVAAMLNQDQNLTEPADSTPASQSVTRWLPESWQGHYTPARARAWIDELDSEATTLLVVEKSTNQPAGLMILFETESGDSVDSIEVRLGYLLSEPFWGRGLASELTAAPSTGAAVSRVSSSSRAASPGLTRHRNGSWKRTALSPPRTKPTFRRTSNSSD